MPEDNLAPDYEKEKEQRRALLEEALKLDSQTPTHALGKKSALQRYIAHLQQLPEVSVDIGTLLPILAHSHTNPELAMEALEQHIALQYKKPQEDGVLSLDVEEDAAKEVAQQIFQMPDSVSDKGLYKKPVTGTYSIHSINKLTEQPKALNKIYLSHDGNHYRIAHRDSTKPPHEGSLSDLSDISDNILSKREKRALTKELAKWETTQVASKALLDLILKVAIHRGHAIEPKILNPSAQADAKPGLWSRVKKWFASPSDVEKLNREFLKSKPDEKKIKTLVRAMCAKNEKIPPDTFKRNPELIIAALKENAQEENINAQITGLKVSGFPLSRSQLEKMKPGEVYFVVGYDTKGYYNNDKISCVAKDVYGKIHYHDYIPIPNDVLSRNQKDPRIIAVVDNYVKEKGAVLSNATLKQNAQLALEDYYFNMANNYLNKAKEPNRHESERAVLLELAVQASLQLPSDQNHFYQNFKEMLFNVQVHGLDANVMQPLSASTQNALSQSHKSPELSFNILQSAKHQYEAMHPGANKSIPSAVAPPVSSVHLSSVSTPVSDNTNRAAQPKDELPPPVRRPSLK